MRAHCMHISKHQNSAFIRVVNICIVYPTYCINILWSTCVFLIYYMYHIEALLGCICIYHMKPLEVNKIDTQINPGFSFFFSCSLTQTTKVKEITSTHCIFSLLFAYWNDPASCRTSTLSSLYLLWCNPMLCLALVLTIHAYSFMLHCQKPACL